LYHQYTAERLEKKADDILQKYKNGLLLTTPQAMDVDHFVEFHLKTQIDFANLSQDGLTLGCTCFNNGVLMVWNDDRTKEIPLNVEKGWIFVDIESISEAVDGNSELAERRVRFTIVHECAHLILHPRFYYKKLGVEIPKIECSVYRIEEWPTHPPMSAEDIREWQANRLGAALIMPARTVKTLMAERLGVSVDELSPVYLSDGFIQGMADIYRVSKSAMSNRLRDLNLLLQ